MGELQRLGYSSSNQQDSRSTAVHDGSADNEAPAGQTTSGTAQPELTQRLPPEAAEYLARLSHELRTPLHGILGMTDAAIRALHDPRPVASPLAPLSTAGQAEVAPLLHMVRQSAISMLNVLNDLLDISKVESGSLVLEEHPFDVTALVRETMAPLVKEARDKGLSFTMDLDPDLPPELHGDSARLRQVFCNIINNAIKFTRMGSINVRIRGVRRNRWACSSERRGRAQLVCTVTDTGVGIPEAQLPRLFESFYQVDGSLSRCFEGAGLGLAISRHLVKMMGGDIWVRSAPGQGSAFTFSVWLNLPPADCVQEPAPTQDAPAAPPLRLPPLRILLAEDNLVNQAFAQLILRREGHTVTTASNGREAMALLSSEAFDLVLMDVRMPELDGVETTRRIRSRDNGILDPDVPIIAMTAHSQRGDRERFLEAGMDDYISKPMAWETVIDIIAAVLQKRGKI
ncbi:response regulator [Megalodesulfovibrio paquesii]